MLIKITNMKTLLLFILTIVPGSAFVIPPKHSVATGRRVLKDNGNNIPCRQTVVVSSAKILPIAYTGASIALLNKAVKAAPQTSKAEMAVLLATSALSLFNLGPSDNENLTGAKRAYKKTAPSVAGKAKQERQAALTWRKVVRIKIVGQIIGLTRMVAAKTTEGVMQGGAILMGSLVLFFLAGAGRSRHDGEGAWIPIPSNVSTMATSIDATLCYAAFVASRSPVDSTKFIVAASIYSVGTAIGALEGIPKFLKVLKGLV
uniref:Uncharacterized protein n=2 Tax=Ditylum brightwellii TaxID=49249 RepID=A0A6U3QYH9_9STRA|mmetsp:Transcript_24611/g.36693  ORF Transcript_24611/g.36693 Transcript_24611/m.36693 type:complete len:260 (+) Transcript_24611:70-849(+)